MQCLIISLNINISINISISVLLFTIQTSFAYFASHTDEKSNDLAEGLNKHELVKEELNCWPFSFYSQVRVIYEVDCVTHLITG